jgi:formylglycine-generating enzyme required for sulfatase activity
MRAILSACLILFVASLSSCKKDESPTNNTPVAPPAGMVAVTGGTFQMGSTAGDSTERPVHSVSVGSFNMDKYEVTYELWTAVRTWALTHGYTDLPTGRNGDNPLGTNNPVSEVSWYDIVKWCNARSEMDGATPAYYTDANQTSVYRTANLNLVNGAVKLTANGYRLPTEAEWDFAARGGTLTHGYEYSGGNDVNAVAWYIANSGVSTHPVGGLVANELGLFDMSGNIWEWVWDWSGTYPSTTSPNPLGPTSGVYRVLRGGGFVHNALECRVANRMDLNPSYRFSNGGGFRCVQD